MTFYHPHQVVAQCSGCHPLLEESSGHKKMRMEPVAKAKRLTPLKQRRSYFDSADYFLEAQNLQQDAPASTQGASMHQHSAHVSTHPSTPTTPLQQQPLPMKLQPCKHTAQPSRLSVRS